MQSETQCPPLLVDTKEAARLCSISERHFAKLDQDDQLGPTSLRLGSCVRWNVAELTEWLNSGCPCRERWRVLKLVVNA